MFKNKELRLQKYNHMITSTFQILVWKYFKLKLVTRKKNIICASITSLMITCMEKTNPFRLLHISVKKTCSYALAIISWMASLTYWSSDLTASFMATCFWESMPNDNRTKTFTSPINWPAKRQVCDLAFAVTSSVP